MKYYMIILKMKEVLKDSRIYFYSLLLPLVLLILFVTVIHAKKNDLRIHGIKISIVTHEETKALSKFLKELEQNPFIINEIEEISKAQGSDVVIIYENGIKLIQMKNIDIKLITAFLDYYTFAYTGDELNSHIMKESNTELRNSIAYSQVIQLFSMIGTFVLYLSVVAFQILEDMKRNIRINRIRYYNKLSISNAIHCICVLVIYSFNIFLVALVTLYYYGLLHLKSIPFIGVFIFLEGVLGLLLGYLVSQINNINRYLKLILLNIFVISSGILAGSIYPKINYYLLEDYIWLQKFNFVSLFTNGMYEILVLDRVVDGIVSILLFLASVAILGLGIFIYKRRRDGIESIDF